VNVEIRKNVIKKIVDKINANSNTPILKLRESQKQWERGNGAVERLDIGIATLLINVQAGKFLVGCDGVKRGINDFLKETLPLNNKNDQNERYKCNDDKIERVIKYYANIKI
jgi:hypothetical protein